MRTFAQPVVVVSKCLGFASCRWNGLTIPDDFVALLRPHVMCRPVCPEVEISLGIPREPVQVVRKGEELRLIQPATQRDLTQAMHSFSAAFLGSLDTVDGFILKGRSPSCGLRGTPIHDLTGETASKGKGSGLFAREVLERFPHLPVEDEARLRNLRRREHYLTVLFTLAAFRKVCASREMGTLVRFHSENELLLRAYHVGTSRTLDKIATGAVGKHADEVISEYRHHLHRALARLPRRPATMGILLEVLGQLSGSLSPEDESAALDALEAYHRGRVPLSRVLHLLRSWVAESQHEYLMGQTFLQPYPGPLMEIKGSDESGWPKGTAVQGSAVEMQDISE